MKKLSKLFRIDRGFFMKKAVVILISVGLLFSFSWGTLVTNKSPGAPPDGSSGGGRLAAGMSELPHEQYVKQGASFLFQALAKVNLAFAKYELDIKDYELLKESLPLFRKAQIFFRQASYNVCISEGYKDVFRNYKYYCYIIYNPRYRLDTMREVCGYIQRADFKGLHWRVSEIAGEMEEAIGTLINDFSEENALTAYRVVQNQFGHYSTTVCRIITQR